MTRPATSDATDADLVAAMCDTRRQQSLLVAEHCRWLDAVDRRQLWRDDGSKALWSWYARQTGCSPATAKATAWLMRGLRVAPLTKAALEAGEIDVDRARELVARATSQRVPVAEAFPGAEELLLSYATGYDFFDFVRLVRYWEAVVDEDGEERQGDTDYQCRNLHANEILRGMVRVDGTLDPIGGATFLACLADIEKELFDADWVLAHELHGPDANRSHLSRTIAQRRADALVEMAKRAAAAPADARRSEPLVVVHAGEGAVARMCELASGTVIAPGLIVPHLGQADIERIVYGPKSRVIDLSEQDRFFRGGLRRAIHLAGRWCAHPSCHDATRHGRVDHIRPRSKGGPTNQTNARWACDTHNWWWWNNQQRFLHPHDPPHLEDTG